MQRANAELCAPVDGHDEPLSELDLREPDFPVVAVDNLDVFLGIDELHLQRGRGCGGGLSRQQLTCDNASSSVADSLPRWRASR